MFLSKVGHEQQQCGWCEKEKEAVTVTFADGFLKEAPLCWSCLQKAIRVRSRQEQTSPPLTVNATERSHKHAT